MLKKVLEKIKPTEKEILSEKKIANQLIEKIKAIKGKHLGAILAGSIARETGLRGDKDIDIFVLFDENTSKEEFEKEGLLIGKKVLKGHFFEKAFSQHPYIRGTINGFDVEIVPSYKVSDPKKLKSAVDRTPFHTKYVQKKLKPEQKDEVRLLRQFLKGIKAYGAEIKTSSVPGYVTELLIIKYGSFENALKGIAKWKEEEVIDLENQLDNVEAKKKFNAPLIIVDPVDKNRNVAAALSLNQFARMIAASTAFLKKPSTNFFFGKKTSPLHEKKVKEHLKKEGLIVVELGCPNVLADILWGQIKRLEKKIVAELEKEEFTALRSSVWTDEKKSIALVFDLKANMLERAKKRIGPLVSDQKNSEKFLAAHKKPLSGPRIENGRWVVEVERKNFDAKKFLKKAFLRLKKTEKTHIKKALNKKAKILTEKEVLQKYRKEPEFSEYFSNYLKGKEDFEEY
ncbi:MAG: CCA tRNA nucleotidyltransferase [Candidatus Diapherotrites archaeon]|nr:CCA tRNA nucleotidyltransferase [Candidatus Diapherotrites archaeon]